MRHADWAAMRYKLGWMKLMNLAAILAICAFVGWLVGFSGRLLNRSGGDSSDGI